ncbi:MAG: amino acid permease, partial [Ignavibacteria bacterium]|nr:amino acid permease [Ignavibacteria bacterium]
MSGGSVENVSPIGPNPSAEYGTSLGLFGAMFAAMLGAFWAYDGWNNIGYLGGEVKNPKKNIPVALFTGVGIVIGIYLLTNFVFLYVMPVSEIIEVAQKDNTIIAVEVMRKFLGFGGAFFISILIMVSTFGTTNGSILASSRIYFAMSRDKLFLSPQEMFTRLSKHLTLLLS